MTLHADANPAPGVVPAHPLDPATTTEYKAGKDILAAAGLLSESVRFAYFGLEEPPKQGVLAGRDGERRLRGVPDRPGNGHLVRHRRVVDPVHRGQRSPA